MPVDGGAVLGVHTPGAVTPSVLSTLASRTLSEASELPENARVQRRGASYGIPAAARHAPLARLGYVRQSERVVSSPAERIQLVFNPSSRVSVALGVLWHIINAKDLVEVLAQEVRPIDRS